MKKTYKSYKFRLTPNKEQEILLAKHFGCVRYVHNHFLNERKQQYEADKKSDNYNAQAKTLVKLKNEECTIWLKEVNSQSLQYSLKNLDTAYKNFFRKNAKFPRFKSRKSKNSFTVPQHAKIVDDRIFLPKFKEGIKVKLHREVKGEIKKFTISKTPTGKHYVSVLVEVHHEAFEKTGKKVGVDLGLKDFAITSQGLKFKNNRYTKKYALKLKKSQQHLSRKQKGSISFERQRRKVAKIHEKISNTRQDVLHKVSTELVKNNDVICLEDLNVKGMIKHGKLSKHIADASWGTFVRFVEYKSDWNNKRCVKINRFFPSSKTCSVCGDENKELKLSDREWTCTNGHHLDRDENAAKNILKEGLKIISLGTSDYTGGDSNKTSLQKHTSERPEAHRSLAYG